MPRSDTWAEPPRRRRPARVFARTMVALLSVAVLATTGYAWATLRGLNGGLAGSDVIGGFSEPDGATDILLIGNDSRTDADGNPLPDEVLKTLRTTDDGGGDLADTMILLRIPHGGGRAGAVSFPRAPLVRLGNGFGKNKLNSAMARAKGAAEHRLQSSGVTDPKQLELQSKAEGQKFLIKTLEDLSGVSIDHYAEVNLLGFYDITKAVGGVPVCLLEPVDEPDSGADFDAGPQRVSGGDALAFVRQRYGLPRNDLDRVRRQQVFMSGLAQEVLSAGTLANPAKLSELVSAVRQSVVLDKGWDVLSFAQQMRGIAGGDIDFQTIPVELVGESGKEDVTIDESEVRQFVADLLLPPQERLVRQQAERSEAEQSEAAQPSESTARPEITAHVYNTTGVTGLAASVQENLAGQGFVSGETANAKSMSSSVVRVAPGESASGEQVAAALGGLPVAESGSVSAGSVQVYLGSDYDGPGAQNFAGAPSLRLDGLQRAAPRPAQSPDPEKPITADGVPCVH
ncbi:LCP family protein [Saccharopolyspora sp.]|uniref:LCP family protein n=1 Tax=Saccharopolyspora sp. TaxID=33915 RepID=UPI0025E71C5D|nr:LCP family protein [Saccharopolyspora sp.]